MVVVAAVVAAVLALGLFAAFQLASPCHSVAEPAGTSVIAAAFAAVVVAAAVGTAAQDLHSFQTAPLLPSLQAADQASPFPLAGSESVAAVAVVGAAVVAASVGALCGLSAEMTVALQE